MVNNVVLMGRLAADPDLRHTPNNAAAASFTLAVERSYAKSGEERQTDFIDVAAWRSTAEFICKYFRKGQMIAVQGSIQTRSYTDKNGNKRKAVEVVANEVSFCGSKGQDIREKPSGQEAAVTAPDIWPDPAEFTQIPSDGDLPF